MGVTVTNLIQGPGTLYRGTYSATGAAEPLDASVNAAPAASAWTDMGGTLGGVNIKQGREFKALEVDQLIDRVETRVTKREFSIEAGLAEVTLDNLALSSNEAIPASGATERSFSPTETTAATQPNYLAMIFDGFAPGGFRRRVIGRRMFNTADPEIAYAKDNQQVLKTEWTGHYVSSTLPRFKIVDQVS